MKNLTVQKRIIIWFALAVSLSLLILLALTYFGTGKIVKERLNVRLMDVVSTNTVRVEYYSEAQASAGGLGDTLHRSGYQFISHKGGWLVIDNNFSDVFEGIHTALYSSDGTLIYGSCPVKGIEPEMNPKSVIYSAGERGSRHYVYDIPLKVPGAEGLWLRGSVSHSEATSTLKEMFEMALILLPIIALLAVIIGYVITRRSFLPVEQLTTAADKIAESGNISARLDIGPGDDELHRLAQSFNRTFDKLEDSFKRERRFTSDASHELRTPTSVIMAQAEYALELAEGEEEYRESLETILRQSRRMSDIISQLLFFARMDQGTESVNMQSTDVSALVAGIAEEQAMLKLKQITISTEIDPGVRANIDSNLFTRMLNNLIGNAYKYGKDGGNIWVRLEGLKGLENPDAPDISDRADAADEKSRFAHFRLSVEDDGIGISQENLEKIWDRFFQVDLARADDPSGGGLGLGLGLSMVRQIARTLGGKIDVSSVLGEGTTFTFVM